MLGAFGHAVATRCDMLGVGSNIFHGAFVNVSRCCMMLWSFGQVRATMLRLGMCTSSIFNLQRVATGWPNACAQQCCDLLRLNVAIVWPELANSGRAMLGCVALRCCYRLTGA